MAEETTVSTPGPGGSWLLPAILFGLWVTAVAEVLSLFGAFRPPFIQVAWLAGAAIAAIVAWRLTSLDGRRRPSGPVRCPPCDGGEGRFQLAVVAGILVLTLVVALAAPPNNWDSLTYHMSRAAHWLQNGSVYPYPTANDRQLFLAPWAEFLGAQFLALAGGDRLANAVQWLAFAGCVSGAWRVAGLLGAKGTGKMLAAFFVATTPMAILQASSSQNDLVVSFWCVAVVVPALVFVSSAPTGRTALLMGAAAGLALLTKSTAALVLAPFGAWLVADAFLKLSGRRVALLGISLGTLLAIGAPFAIRNARAMGNPLGGATRIAAYRNELGTPASVVSGLVRNAALHACVPIQGFRRNAEAAVASVHRWIGLESSDPRTTWQGTRFGVGSFVIHEDFAGCPLQFLLYGALVPLALFSRRKPLRLYGLALSAGFVLFCATLKWQPWMTRLQLPFFVLAAPAAAAVLEDCRSRLRVVLVGLMAIGAAPYVVKNWTRPLWPDARCVLTAPRMRQMFANDRELGTSFEELSRYLGTLPFSRLGLVMSGDDLEYPFWAFVRGAGGTRPRIEHVDLRVLSVGETASLASGSGLTATGEPFGPEVIVWDASRREFPKEGRFELLGVPFKLVRTIGVYHVLVTLETDR